MDGDQAGFTRWASQRQLALLRTAVLLTGDHHRAEDLVQEALVKVALRWSRLHDGNPEAYARQVIVRDNISWWRRHRKDAAYVAEPAPPPVPDSSASTERRVLLDRALAGLTPGQRSVLVLRYFDDLSERDAAEALGVSAGTVKSQTHLALRRLRETAPELAELLPEVT